MLTNAVTGSTTDGTLQLNQQANGGAGGEGDAGPGGQGGAAASDLTFDDTASPNQSAMVEVENGASAGAAGAGAIGSVAGVDASSETTITGAKRRQHQRVHERRGGRGVRRFHHR